MRLRRLLRLRLRLLAQRLLLLRPLLLSDSTRPGTTTTTAMNATTAITTCINISTTSTITVCIIMTTWISTRTTTRIYLGNISAQACLMRRSVLHRRLFVGHRQHCRHVRSRAYRAWMVATDAPHRGRWRCRRRRYL